MKAAQKSFAKPNPLLVLADYLMRRMRGQLHLPPRWLRDVGPSDFEATGREFLDLFIRLANLRPNERVLDIGCGCGRMALPLSDYLGRDGLYVGMDITARPVLWCRQNIASHHPNFMFLHMDLYNTRYNPTGRYRAGDYTFPFKDESFDFIFLTSVFTHLLPDDVANYLDEIARLLQPAGRALATFFLLNQTQQALAGQGRNQVNFQYGSGPYRMRSDSLPESAVAYEETFLRQMLKERGLVVSEPVYYGTWSGREEGVSLQDIVLLQRLPDK